MPSPEIKLRAIVAAALLAVPVMRASALDRPTGYVTARDGEPVTDSFGDCWHTRDWRPGMRFANCEPPPPRALAAAAVAAKPAAPVREAEAPPKPAPRAAPFRLSADALFAFDSAALKREGRVALDLLERQIGSASYRSVQITGHTDRLGAPSYNQRLSERRALAVRAYLAAHGLDAHRMLAKGVGSTQPVTAADWCEGRRDARLIQCLQPDRYAEVSVVATARAASAQ
jgi:OOP family OmpA-OmpF porin